MAKKYSTIPEKSGLLIVRVSAIMAMLLVHLFVAVKLFSRQDLTKEISTLLTLGIALGALLVMAFHPKAYPKTGRFYLPLLAALLTIVSLTLPLLFTNQTNPIEFFTAFWLVIPALFVPLALIGLQYNILVTFFYSLLANLLDLLIMIQIQWRFHHDLPTVMDILRENQILPNLLLRFLLMCMIGLVISLLVRSIHEKAAQLSTANQELEAFNQHLEERVFERTQALDAVNKKILQGWVQLMELRHLEPTGHTERMLHQGEIFGKKLSLSLQEQEVLRQTILLHDVGKLGIPDRILLKPDSLTEQEYAHAKLHVEYSIQILQGIDYLAPCVEVIAAHHERWNGSGYPHGLQKKEIPFITRVFMVMEVYDILTHDTIYRKAWTPEKARKHLLENSGILFDPLVVAQFVGLLETQDLDHYSTHR